MNGNDDFLYKFGGFADFQYREKDLYQNGFTGTNSYETHGEPEKIELQHLVFRFHSIFKQKYLFGVEFNRHNGSNETFDELLQRLFLGYRTDTIKIRVGRLDYGISYFENIMMGYGFSQMPLVLTSQFASFFGDGISIKYGEKSSGEIYFLKDAISDAQNFGLKFKYQFYNNNFIAYYQNGESFSKRFDASSTSHEHSHGTGCSNLSGDEVCFNNEREIFGVGINSKFGDFDFISELIFSKESGDIRDKSYLVSDKLEAKSFYSQIIYSPLEDLNFGFRYETINYKNSFSGSGATEIAEKLEPQNLEIENLYTFMAGYNFLKYNFLRFEIEKLEKENSFRLQYRLNF
jgi:hypothetical protein